MRTLRNPLCKIPIHTVIIAPLLLDSVQIEISILTRRLSAMTARAKSIGGGKMLHSHAAKANGIKWKICAAALLAVSTWSIAQDAPSLYGIALGKPLPMPECAKINSGSYVKRTSSDSTCYQETIGYIHTVYFHSDSRPSMAKAGHIEAYVREGTTIRVSLVTDGIESQEEDLGKLITKFGKPSSLRRETMVNGYGARYSAISADWTIGVNALSFRGAMGRLDEGMIALKSPAAIELDRRMIDAMNKDKNL